MGLSAPISVNNLSLLITRGQREPAHYAKRKKVCINECFTSLARYQGTKLRLFCLKSKIFSNFFMFLILFVLLFYYLCRR